jgi:hypothetical protein
MPRAFDRNCDRTYARRGEPPTIPLTILVDTAQRFAGADSVARRHTR